MQSEIPPPPTFARRGANPTLETIEYIRNALRGAGGPMSRKRLHATLTAWGHGTSTPSLNAALGFLAQDGAIVEGSKGFLWVSDAPAPMIEVIRRKRT